MGTLIRLLEKLVFLAAAVVIIFLAQMSKSYAATENLAALESLPGQQVIAVSLQD